MCVALDIFLLYKIRYVLQAKQWYLPPFRPHYSNQQKTKNSWNYPPPFRPNITVKISLSPVVNISKATNLSKNGSPPYLPKQTGR